MGVFANRRFRLLWAGQTVSLLGSQVSLIALPLLAVNELHASASEVGALVTAQFAPFLLLGLPAGAWVDRMARRRVLIVCDVARALVLLAIPIAFATGTLALYQLYAVGALHGVLTVFFDVAYQSYLPELVEREQLPEANGRLELSRSGAQIAGPSVGGWLVSLLRAPFALVVDSLSFLFSAAMLWRIPASVRALAGGGARAASWRGLLGEILEGLRFVLRNRVLAPIALCTGLLNLSYGMIFALIVVFAAQALGMPSQEIGLAMGLGNVGFLAGALAVPRIGRRVGIGPSIVLGALLTGLGPLLIPLAPPSNPAPVLVAGLLVEWFGVAAFNINQVSLRQAITPPELLGRMNATMRFVVWGTLPIGSTIASSLAGSLGLRNAMWAAVLVGVLPFAIVLLSATSRVRSLQPVELQRLAAGSSHRDRETTRGG